MHKSFDINETVNDFLAWLKSFPMDERTDAMNELIEKIEGDKKAW